MKTDESICSECGKVRTDKIFGTIADPCRCIRKDKDYIYSWDKKEKGEICG